MKLIAIGDNVCDCYPDEGIFFPGGNCVNVAVHAKRCGAQDVNYTGVFGDDFMAEYIKDCLAEEGVTTHRCRTVSAATSQPVVKLVNGDRVFVGGKPDSCQAVVAMRMTASDLELASRYDICHISCYSNMENEVAKLAKVLPLSFDFSDIKDDDYFAKICPHLTFAFLSGSELSPDECRNLATRLMAYGTRVVGITRGEQGSIFCDGQHFYYGSAHKTDAVDTMGAGDSFIGAFLVAYLDGRTMEQSLHLAACHAADNCTKHGAIGYARRLE